MHPQPRQPERLPTGSVPRDRPGAPWWRYRLDPGSPVLNREPRTGYVIDIGGPGMAPWCPLRPGPPRLCHTDFQLQQRSRGLGAVVNETVPVPFVIVAFAAAAGALLCGRGSGNGILARVCVGALGLALAAALGRFVQNRHRRSRGSVGSSCGAWSSSSSATIGRYYAFVGSDKRSDAQVYGGYARSTCRASPSRSRTCARPTSSGT